MPNNQVIEVFAGLSDQQVIIVPESTFRRQCSWPSWQSWPVLLCSNILTCTWNLSLQQAICPWNVRCSASSGRSSSRIDCVLATGTELCWPRSVLRHLSDGWRGYHSVHALIVCIHILRDRGTTLLIAFLNILQNQASNTIQQLAVQMLTKPCDKRSTTLTIFPYYACSQMHCISPILEKILHIFKPPSSPVLFKTPCSLPFC